MNLLLESSWQHKPRAPKVRPSNRPVKGFHVRLTLEKLRTLAAGVHAHEVEQGSKRYTQRGEVSPGFEKALKALDLQLPPVVWSAWIEPKKKAKKRKASAS